MVRRRKSSSADGTIGGEHERWTPPLVGGGGGGGAGVSPVKILNFNASLCVLMGFYAFGTRSQSRFFARKDISWRVRIPNAKQNRFKIVTIFFTFFFSIFLRHYVTYVPAGFCKVLLALILGCHGQIQRGGGTGGPDPPLKNHKNRVSKQYWSRSTKPLFNVGPLSARQLLTQLSGSVTPVTKASSRFLVRNFP